jgi:outer membrane lipoprotein carrier protein
MKKVLLILAIALLNPGVSAHAASDPLDRFFNDVLTFKASFNQVVLDEALNPIQESSGTLYLQRPNKFRWDYDQPFKQHIVSDGKQIWVYDVELQQVTVRKMDGALGNTPAILLAGKGKLGDNFQVKVLGKQGTLEWVKMIPKNKDGGFEDIRVGFEKGKIRKLEMIDSFGQITRIDLRNNRENKRINKSKFRFTPPKGVDVVRQ